MRTSCLLLITVMAVAPLPAVAQSATIHRDAWGVPHVVSATDAGALFGMAWALAEDDWPLIQENYLHALGRAAELHGERVLRRDWYARAMEIPRLSEQEYRNSSASMKAMLDAFAAGLNEWLRHNPGQHLTSVEPWYPLALIRYKYYVNEFLGYAELEDEHTDRLFADGLAGQQTLVTGETPPSLGEDSPLRTDWPLGERPFGSNQWALAGSRTASGHPMLLINPHQSFVGVQRYAEIHLDSDEGLRFSGLTVFGFLLPYMGNNDRLGWAYTDNYADHSDTYAEALVDGLHYRFGDEVRPMETWLDTIRVQQDARVFRFWKTHHGPVLGLDARGRPLAVKLPRYAEGGWFTQWDAMIRARNLEQWKSAASLLRVPYMNIMYADADGNIGYVYGSAVPRRLPGVDPSGILDGSDPRTEWQGFHAFGELPQIFNPASGWLLNTNSSPFHATVNLPFTRADFPPYMIGRETNNPRAVSSAGVLGTLRNVSLEDFARAATDTRLSAADTLLADLNADTDPNVRRLLAWDRRAHANSVETAWFVLAAERRGQGRVDEQLPGVLADLRNRFGTTEVTWGEINRIQRPLPNSDRTLDATRPSLPVHGAPGALGSIFTYNTEGFREARPRNGVHGNSFVKIIEFGPRIEARSILNYGQSGDPASAHWFDQAALYSRGEFKQAWFDRSDVEANAVRSYTVRASGR